MRWTGNDSPLPFPVLFSLRSQLGRSRSLTAFTVIAIGTSVALATGLEISTRGVEAELARTADALVGSARLEVTAGTLGVREGLLERVAAIPGVAAATPLIQETYRIEEGPLDGLALRMVGVDFLSDHKIRGYAISDGGVEVADPIRLLARLESVIVPQELALRANLRQGDSLRVHTPRGRVDLVIRGLLLPGGVADAYQGQLAVMDIYSLQELEQRRGWFDRIDIVPGVDVDLDALEARVAKEVAGVATVRPSTTRGEFVDQAFGAVNLAVGIIAGLGVLVAAFLTYGTISLSVDRRAEELALLQSVGLEPARVRRLVRIDTLLAASFGTVAGLGGGLGLARLLFTLLTAVSDQVSGTDPALQFSVRTLLLGGGVGLVISLVASVEPGRRASARPPLELLRSRGDGRHIGPRRKGVALSMVSAAVLLICWLVEAAIPPLAELGVVLIASLTLLTTSGPRFMVPAMRVASTVADRLVPGVGSFIGSSLVARPLNTSLTLAGTAAVVGALSGMLIVLGSIEHAFRGRLEGMYSDGLIVSATDPFGEIRDDAEVLAPDVVRAIRSLPELEGAVEMFFSRILFHGTDVILVARSYTDFARYGLLPVPAGDATELARRIAAGEVAVNEAFSRSFALSTGDLVSLDTPAGPREFRIAGILRDFAGRSGTVHTDLTVFDRHWTRPGAMTMVVFPKAGAEAALIEAIRSESFPRRGLFLMRWSKYVQHSAGFVDDLVSILYTVAGLTATVGGLAVLNLLMGAASARRREFALLRTAGASRFQLGMLVVADGMLTTTLAVGLGIGLGWSSSTLMCHTLVDLLGWVIPRTVDWEPQALVAAIAILGAGLASVVPALFVARASTTEMFWPD